MFISCLCVKDSRISTTGGNSKGAKCVFPFKYQGILRYSCMQKDHVGEDGSVSYVKFCATTSDYDTDQKWVRQNSHGLHLVHLCYKWVVILPSQENFFPGILKKFSKNCIYSLTENSS